ncbi:molybdenum cofactor synthesis domain-containing protein [Natranaerovirga pectinivora]|uniref:Molybdopterin molybdenumtransferase n=1 Tax=Natranaerovirga pectinivora TaxID=682400 RepID=A0A4V2V0L2_9FIRM|nr:molybdopterin-binding protein [Natranaerovirga pectinivora]TCT16749.1 molybdenum cofactor synthesis domain-containing protein [Natranaerovirga pectinivora]
MKVVSVEDAVGMVLAHDLTKIVSDEFKGAAFKKGHIIRSEDIESLKKMGKFHINIIELGDNEVHEEEAAFRIGKGACGEGVYLTEPSEGKVSLKAMKRGLLKVNRICLESINEIEDIILSTRHSGTIVEKDQLIAGTKIIPLVTDKDKVELAERICKEIGSVVSVKSLFCLKVGVVVTGTEVYNGIIEDKFAPVLEEKVKALGGNCLDVIFVPDDEFLIKEAINNQLNNGAELVMVSGGMAVDADDITPVAIKDLGTEVISYGSPVLPGAMFMIAYKGDIPILGIPACGMFNKITVLDIVLPRIFAKEKITKKDIVALAHGGLCLACEVCRYPICPMGK